LVTGGCGRFRARNVWSGVMVMETVGKRWVREGS
jgi:hypothetical protein